MDLGRQKIQISQNRMKLAPLRRAHCSDSGHIFFFENGHRMHKLSHYDVQVKHEKKFNVKVKVNRSKSMMTLGVRHDDVRNVTWQHLKMTCVSQIWYFRAKLDKYRSDMWHCTDDHKC